MSRLEKYLQVRQLTESICKPLQKEDYVVQPVVDVSPPKWHLGHTTWFFETMILKPFVPGYVEYDPDFNYVFNSYYETLGARVIRTDRGNLSRPTVDEIYQYREHVNQAMQALLSRNVNKEIETLVILGCNHEEQHQELLWTDIKYILGHNPLFPAYDASTKQEEYSIQPALQFIEMKKGLYEVGYSGDDFCFDNELNWHMVYLQDYGIANALITNKEYLEFINDGGYQNFIHWHAEGWDWVNNNNIQAPLYWHKNGKEWYNYTLQGLKPIDLLRPVCHINYYEAAAYAAWVGKRLPTEFEWEAAALYLNRGDCWEWTESAYLPYPGFKKAAGAVGEYNGKFMVNQKVLRGASRFTSPGHSRITYRNFFHAPLRWQLTGIRLAQ